MNGDTLLIVCFALLLILIIATFVYFFGFYRRRDISGKPDAAPAERKKRPPDGIDVPIVQRPAPQPAFIVKIRRNEDNAVFDIDLTHGAVTLGRLSGCTDSDYLCAASNADVSKRHCTLKIDENGQVIITDNGSTNHTYVNGRRIDSPALIRSGDTFSLGRSCAFTMI